MKFYGSRTGARYHRSVRCEGLNSVPDDEVPTVTLREIRRRNLQPCLTCQPPPIPRVVAEPEEQTG